MKILIVIKNLVIVIAICLAAGLSTAPAMALTDTTDTTNSSSQPAAQPKTSAKAASDKCGNNTTGGLIHTSLPTTCASQSTLAKVLNIVFVVIGAIAVFIVVLGGFRYIRAGSNETIVAESRRQIVHALVGLIVAVSAAVIVNFVLGRMD